MSDDRDYPVGYGKPPAHSRFQPGTSGNPRGRQKGARGLRTDLEAELKATQTVKINGKTHRGTAQRLMIKGLATRAAYGDIKAAREVIPLILQLIGPEDRNALRRSLSAMDQTILDEVLGRTEAELGTLPDTAPAGKDRNDD